MWEGFYLKCKFRCVLEDLYWIEILCLWKMWEGFYLEFKFDCLLENLFFRKNF